MNEIVRRLKSLEGFNKASELELREWASFMKCRRVPARQILYNKGEPISEIYIILCGSVRIFDSPDLSDKKIFNFLGRGEYLGIAMAGLPDPHQPATAQCIEDCTFISMPLNIYNELLKRLPEVRRIVNCQISQRFLELQNDICISHQLTPSRVAELLMRLLARQEFKSTNRLQIPLTRVDIAERIGAQSETVIRIMSQWTKKGWIRTDEKHIEVLQPEALEALRHGKNCKRTSRSASDPAENDL
ncbi:MAG: hypothetical protein OM95_03725 [Bdellovibrio sp. ArHS]|uniref:Crp/Fnr family transcriptional regulator n=1 Tax=Bdellovibrio sp. ArHS TaxID=1569284 RepID=UPI000583DAA3|nr:Crp/Fnr family transcriptional regulator [Bdellovibrio sp. ArHS]KHD89476.1 MAG: hypothetical protein OM95_03725 [Bdellovibrio sp. ArHS]